MEALPESDEGISMVESADSWKLICPLPLLLVSIVKLSSSGRLDCTIRALSARGVDSVDILDVVERLQLLTSNKS